MVTWIGDDPLGNTKQFNNKWVQRPQYDEEINHGTRRTMIWSRLNLMDNSKKERELLKMQLYEGVVRILQSIPREEAKLGCFFGRKGKRIVHY
jgi:hypothetical protein